MKTFFEVITEAINDMIDHGFDSQKRVKEWVKKIKEAAKRDMISDSKINKELERSLNQAYSRLVTKGGLISKDVSKYTIDKLKPTLRAELDRRIMASANLIKYNRQESINTVLRRFEGWATSIPKGGSDVVDKKKEKANVRKSLSKLPFEERRVIIDQTHKLVANINQIVAQDNGAIAAMWHSNWKQEGYNYRKDHKERDKVIYLIRNSWAREKGYVKPVNGYTDQITNVGEEVFCRCKYQYIYSLRNLPREFLTKKGESALNNARLNN